jgi:hypothetical protein
VSPVELLTAAGALPSLSPLLFLPRKCDLRFCGFCFVEFGSLGGSGLFGFFVFWSFFVVVCICVFVGEVSVGCGVFFFVFCDSEVG